jgi:hypothetical protein
MVAGLQLHFTSELRMSPSLSDLLYGKISSIALAILSLKILKFIST